MPVHELCSPCFWLPHPANARSKMGKRPKPAGHNDQPHYVASQVTFARWLALAGATAE